MKIIKNLLPKKPVEQICRNCRLFSSSTETCQVRILHSGKTWRDIPVNPREKCLWEDLGVSDQIKEVRFWTEDKNGQTTNGNGVVKMEYPPGYFGPDEESSIV